MNNAQPRVYLIDASIYIFRAWFSVPDSMRGDDGSPVNAAYGFCRFLTEFVERSNASHVAVAFDESLTTSFRNDAYPQYKMNRELPAQELKDQFKLCRRAAQAAGLYCVSSDRYEADDLIATLTKSLRDQGFKITVVSGDKDLAQVLGEGDFWWDFARDNMLDHDKVLEKFGVPPEAIQDYLGLCGDAVDNIPGVPGIGPKTASALLQRYSSMEELYENLDMIRHLQIRGAKTLAAKLREHKDQAFLSKQLATVAYDAPIDTQASTTARRAAEQSSLQEISQIMDGRGGGLFERLLESSKRALADA
ncbi:MAG: DNA polymerase-1 [Cryomorphaceae bacterium]|jgi:DNA polymerase-1